MDTQPKILLYDIETAKAVFQGKAYSRKLPSKFIPSDWIIRDIWMPCVAWKWIGDSYTASTSVLHDPERFERDYADDWHVVNTLHKLISEADIIVAHNGNQFDWKIFMDRVIFHDLPVPPEPLMIDTLQQARTTMRSTANDLRYLCRKWGLPLKDNSPNWDAVAEGDVEALQYCERYCRQDIKALEGLYYKLRPYMKRHPNLNAMIGDGSYELCPRCSHWDLIDRGDRLLMHGSDNFINGHKHTGAGRYERVQCNSNTGGCGAWAYKSKNLVKVSIK